MKINLPIMALACGAFGIGLTEFTPMGLLPVIAQGVHVSIPTAGLLVTGYALGVMVGAPVMTLSTGRMPRRTLLIALATVFTIGNVLSALAGSYAMLMVARVITALNHGAFFGVGSVVAASLVAPERRAGAVAAMFMGLTIANVIGVPGATWIGENFGWRATFWVIAALGLVTMAALRTTLPGLPGNPDADGLSEIRSLLRPRVLAALLLTVLGSGAMFTVFTYIAPILHNATHKGDAFVNAMLVVYGLGLTAGNWVGGKCADRSVDRTLVMFLALLTVVLLAFSALMASAVAAAVLIFLFGACAFALVPPLQIRVMQVAHEAPNLAASVNIAAFNLGNALGAALGGWAIAAGLGYPAVAIVAAAISASGLLAVALLRTLETRGDAATAPSHAG